MFTVLPFGLATGPYIFTKVTRPLVKHWRTTAVNIVVYLEDGMGACKTFSACMNQASKVRSDIKSCGSISNDEKCEWFASQCLTWLGFDWNLKLKTLCIPKKKIDLCSKIDETLDSSGPARQLASVTGLIISNSMCNLVTKSLRREIDFRLSWDCKLNVNCGARRELEFWVKSISMLNSRSLLIKPTSVGNKSCLF